MAEGSSYTMIVAAVNQGYSDEVIDTARSAGAMGEPYCGAAGAAWTRPPGSGHFPSGRAGNPSGHRPQDQEA